MKKEILYMGFHKFFHCWVKGRLVTFPDRVVIVSTDKSADGEYTYSVVNEVDQNSIVEVTQ